MVSSKKSFLRCIRKHVYSGHRRVYKAQVTLPPHTISDIKRHRQKVILTTSVSVEHIQLPQANLLMHTAQLSSVSHHIIKLFIWYTVFIKQTMKTCSRCTSSTLILNYSWLNVNMTSHHVTTNVRRNDLFYIIIINNIEVAIHPYQTTLAVKLF